MFLCNKLAISVFDARTKYKINKSMIMAKVSLINFYLINANMSAILETKNKILKLLPWTIYALTCY